MLQQPLSSLYRVSQRLKITLQYEGTHFCGWAKQLAVKPSGLLYVQLSYSHRGIHKPQLDPTPSVQGALESALEKITGITMRSCTANT